MDVPYLIHVPDGDELWLVDGEQRLLITPRIYDLLASNGADLPPAYGIEELREQNAKLRELVVRMFHTIELSDRMSDSMYWPSFSYERELRELGVEL